MSHERQNFEQYGLYSTAVGPIAWAVLHCVAANYPYNYHQLNSKEQKHIRESYKGFLHRFAEVFPCNPCSIHWLEHLKRHPIPLEAFASRCAFSKYVHDMHTDITRDIEQRNPDSIKTKGVPFKQMLTFYESLRCPPPGASRNKSVHAVVRFQASRPEHSIQMDPSVALSTPEQITCHLKAGGWCPGIDGDETPN